MDTIDIAPPVEAPSPLRHGPIEKVVGNLASQLAPAQWIIQEWRDYWYVNPDAALVTVGTRPVLASPPGSGNYLIRFENQLGLASIRVYDTVGQEIDRAHVEVIASKFGSAAESVDFLRQTLTALHSHVASTPFTIGADTERLVRESPVPPGPLFTFHFFRTHAAELVRAVQAVLGRPHQRLDAEPILVRPHEVRQVDREALVWMLRAGHSSPTPLGSREGVSPLQRLRPERVWQRIPFETYDTPENRFVLHACRQMLRAVSGLAGQAWFQEVPAATRAPITHAGEYLAMLTVDDRFAPLGPLVVTPAQSRVLQRKDGYRELAVLWHQFQRSREPLFEQLQSAIDLRQVDQLYELWVLFEVISQIGEITGSVPVLFPKVDVFGAPVGGYRAAFADHGTLTYNRTTTTYSGLPLRPDYLWEPVGKGAAVALDAKFRLRQPKVLMADASGAAVWAATDGPATATADDLTKMHAYRDAIPNVRAAIVLYPGATTVFRSLDRVKRVLTLAEILFGHWEGIGAIALAPHGVTVRDDDVNGAINS